ncbi:MAG: hypothetical protein AAB699_02135 [Patescibacteria group bacterium]
MKTDIVPKIEKLLKDGKQDEARALLREALSAPLSEEERGALLVGFAAAYLALTESVNAARRDELAEEAEALEKIGELERRIDEKLQLVKVRQGLTE